MLNLIPKALLKSLKFAKKVGDFIVGKFKGGSDDEVVPQDINWALFDAIEDSLSRTRKIHELELLRGKKGSKPGFSDRAFKRHNTGDDWHDPGKTPLYVRGKIAIVIDWQEFEKRLAERTDRHLADLVTDALNDRDVRRQMLKGVTSEHAEEVFISILQEEYHRGRLGEALEKKVLELLREETGKRDFDLRLNTPKLLKKKSKVSDKMIAVAFELVWNVRFRGFWRP